MRIKFSETFPGARVVTQYGSIFEKAPLVGDLYELQLHRDNVYLFRNVSQTHHTIMWWLEKYDDGYFFGGSSEMTGFVGSGATFEVIGGGE
jgi:hypothetical protein